MLLNNLHFYAVIRRRKDECPFFGTCASPKMGPTRREEKWIFSARHSSRECGHCASNCSEATGVALNITVNERKRQREASVCVCTVRVALLVSC